jgi:hypothetical protein
MSCPQAGITILMKTGGDDEGEYLQVTTMDATEHGAAALNFAMMDFSVKRNPCVGSQLYYKDDVEMLVAFLEQWLGSES